MSLAFLPRMTLWGCTSTCVDAPREKFPTDLEPFMIVEVTPFGKSERPGDTDLRIPFAIMDGFENPAGSEAFSQRMSSFKVSFEGALREMVRDGSLAWTDVVFAHSHLLGMLLIKVSRAMRLWQVLSDLLRKICF